MENSPEIQQYLSLLCDPDAWNRWRSQHPELPLNLARVSLPGANLSAVDIREINFTRANLAASKFAKADCRRTCFAGANLKGSDLGGADLRGANLKWANLTRTQLRRANLSGANLSGADLTGADLSGAELQGANLEGIKLTGAVMPDGTLYGMVRIEAEPVVEAAEPVTVTPESEAPAESSATVMTGSASLDQFLTEPTGSSALEGEIQRVASSNGKHYTNLTRLLLN